MHTEERRIKECHDLIHLTRAAEAEAAHWYAPIFAEDLWSGSHRAVRALHWGFQLGWSLEAAAHPWGPPLIPQVRMLGRRTDEKGACTSSSVPWRHLGCPAGEQNHELPHRIPQQELPRHRVTLGETEADSPCRSTLLAIRTRSAALWLFRLSKASVIYLD